MTFASLGLAEPIARALADAYQARCRGLSSRTVGRRHGDETDSLDDHRGMTAQRATEARRQKAEVIKDQLMLQARRDEIEKVLFAGPARDWSEAVAKARYVLARFAESPTAEDPRHRLLIDSLLAAFERLLTANDNTADPV